MTEAQLRRAARPLKLDDKLVFKMRKDFAHGDQLGVNYEYYIGRKPIRGTSSEEFKFELADFEAIVATNDQIKPGLENVANATLGRDPEWTLKLSSSDVTSALLNDLRKDEFEDLSNDEKNLASTLSELETLSGAWHRDAELRERLWDAHYKAQWAGESYVRLLVPSELTRRDVFFDSVFAAALYGEDWLADPANFDLVNPRVTPGSLDSLSDALERICLEVHTSETIREIKQGHTVLGYAVLYKKENDDRSYFEVHDPFFITHYVEENNQLKPLVDERYLSPFADVNANRVRNPWFLIVPMKRTQGSVLDPDLIQKQQRLNISVTNGNRNDDLYGWRSAITTNADEITETINGVETEVSWTIGPRVVTMLRGLPTKVSDALIPGEEPEVEGYTTPGVHFIDPLDPEYSIKWSNYWEYLIARKLNQEHLLGDFKAVSGESKKQDQKTFDRRIIREAAYVAPAGQNVILRAIAFANYMTKAQIALDVSKLECIFKLYLDISKGSLDTFKTMSDARQRGHVSLESLVEANPIVTDAASELKRLQNENAQSQDELVQRRLLFAELYQAHEKGYTSLETVVKNNPGVTKEAFDEELANVKAALETRRVERETEIEARLNGVTNVD